MADVCCWACRTPSGVCLSRHSCQHHKDAQRQDDADDKARRLYNNPTQDKAIANVMRERRKER